ncbi:MAG: hypothetical protein K6G84_12655, partial [Lachnospiraceae bacterium]|nr:hypothetical protein [Lachnospiraceae bacterium]
YDFTGYEIHPSVTVKIGNENINPNTYYEIDDTTGGNIEVGNHQIILSGTTYEGVKNIEGSVTIPFEIKEKELDTSEVTLNVSGTYTYDGNEQIPADSNIKIKVKSTGLEIPTTRRNLEFKDNVNAGEAKVIIKLKDGFTGELSGKFTINPYDLKNIDVDEVADHYLDLEDKPVPISVKAYYDKTRAKELIENTDYTLSFTKAKGGENATRTSGDFEKNSSVSYAGIKYSILPKNGNYTGEKTGSFKLLKLPMDEKHLDIVQDPATFTYDGTAKKPKLTVTYKYDKDMAAIFQAVLTSKDYNARIKNNIDAGNNTAYVEITGLGIYDNSKVYYHKFSIQSADIGGLTVSAPSVDFDGEEHDTVYIDGLVRWKDYQIGFSTSDLINAGKIAASIRGKGNYTGTNSASYEIRPIDASKLTISGLEEYYIYSGSSIEPEVTVKYGDTNLEEGIDYSVSYSNNKDAGDTAEVSVTGLKRNVIEGTTKTANFKIYQGVFDTANMEVSGLENVEIIDGEAEPKFTLSFNGTELTEGVDFTYKYDGDLTSVGVVKLVVTGTGKYTGTYTYTFVVKEKAPDDISDSRISATISPNVVIYDGEEHMPKVYMTANGMPLTENKDFTVSYEDNVDVGTAIAKVSGMGDYSGKITLTFEIVAISIKDANFEYVKEHNYNTAEIEPDLTVSYNGITLRERLDYIVTYKDNIEPGKGKMIVSGNGNYKDTVTLEFDIVDPYAMSDDSTDKKDEEEKKDDKKSESNDEEDEDAENIEDVENKVPESISSNVTEVQAAIMKNYGSVDDTVVLTHAGSKFVLTGLSGNDAVITVAKGNKFTIEDGMNGSFSSADNKTVSVSPRGVVKAKAATNGTKILFMNSSGENVELTVKVIDPKILDSNKRSINLSVGGKIGVQVNVPLNAHVVDIKNNGVAKITNPSFNEAGKLEVDGTAMHKGAVKMRLKVYNKGYTIKLRVK